MKDRIEYWIETLNLKSETEAFKELSNEVRSAEHYLDGAILINCFVGAIRIRDVFRVKPDAPR